MPPKKRFEIKVKLKNTNTNAVADRKAKDAARKRAERARKKETETPEEKTIRLQKRNKRQQRERQNLSSPKKKAIYKQQAQYKTRVWLNRPGNREKQNSYCRESRIRNYNHNAFEAGTSCKEY